MRVLQGARRRGNVRGARLRRVRSSPRCPCPAGYAARRLRTILRTPAPPPARLPGPDPTTPLPRVSRARHSGDRGVGGLEHSRNGLRGSARAPPQRGCHASARVHLGEADATRIEVICRPRAHAHAARGGARREPRSPRRGGARACRARTRARTAPRHPRVGHVDLEPPEFSTSRAHVLTECHCCLRPPGRIMPGGPVCPLAKMCRKIGTIVPIRASLQRPSAQGDFTGALVPVAAFGLSGSLTASACSPGGS